MMFFHAEADALVPISNAEVMAAALEKAGVPAKIVRIPGGTHDHLLVPGAPDFRGEMVHWLDKYLKSSSQ